MYTCICVCIYVDVYICVCVCVCIHVRMYNVCLAFVHVCGHQGSLWCCISLSITSTNTS